MDELIILNIDKKNNNEQYNTSFFEDTEKILKKCFLPVAIGGGINNFEIAKKLFNSGADKIILNSAFYSNRDLI